jgi:hypothetical protein
MTGKRFVTRDLFVRRHSKGFFGTGNVVITKTRLGQMLNFMKLFPFVYVCTY